MKMKSAKQKIKSKAKPPQKQQQKTKPQTKYTNKQKIRKFIYLNISGKHIKDLLL